MQFDHLCMLTQFHLLDNQLYLTRTDFSTRLNSNQYEYFLNGFIGIDYHLDRYTGVLPYYIKDKQSTLLRILNPKGYPSVTYYSGDQKLQAKIENIIKQQNRINFSKKQIS